MYSNKLYTPLRYPGGKARFAPFIAELMQRNDLAGGHYLEPFAGGAGVALELLFHGLVEHVHINDIDPAVAAFWRAVTEQPQALIELVAQKPVTIEAWHYWRSVMLGRTAGTALERGFATLFMNRTNRSGILKGGVIGGLAQAGTYKMDARFKRDVLIKRLERIAEFANYIHVYEEDAHSLLSRCCKFLPTKSLVYLDPPYYVKGAGLYRNFYQHADHERIAKLLKSRCFRRQWVVSYDNVEEIKIMYSYARAFTYGLKYTAQTRYEGSEVMFFSPNLNLGEMQTMLLQAS
jgi:DNA adenine methylase